MALKQGQAHTLITEDGQRVPHRQLLLPQQLRVFPQFPRVQSKYMQRKREASTGSPVQPEGIDRDARTGKRGRFRIAYDNTAFIAPGTCHPHANRLNWRGEILLTRNRGEIEGKRILDLASHDGHFSYACLKLGATRVTGIEFVPQWADSARKNLLAAGYKPPAFDFIHADVFDYLPEVKAGDFDTVLCLGFLHNTARQIELLSQLRRIRPRCVVLDTDIARGVFTGSHVPGNDGPAHGNRKRSAAREAASSLLKRFSHHDGTACLVFSRGSVIAEGDALLYTNLVALPTADFIEVVVPSFGLEITKLHWDKSGVDDWSHLEDYRRGDRVSYIARGLSRSD
jgi:SAM-dependent methyltransferase